MNITTADTTAMDPIVFALNYNKTHKHFEDALAEFADGSAPVDEWTERQNRYDEMRDRERAQYAEWIEGLNARPMTEMDPTAYNITHQDDDALPAWMTEEDANYVRPVATTRTSGHVRLTAWK
jgi:hypothetical protein